MAAGDLTTLVNARTFLQKFAADTQQDSLVSLLITSASAAVMRYAEREFAPVSTGLTRIFETELIGDGWVDLAPYDIRNVTSIQLDYDYASPITLQASEWRAWPQPSVDGTFLALRVEPFAAIVATGRFRNRQVAVTGDWGFAQVPADVEQATWFTVKEWLETTTHPNPGLQADIGQQDTSVGSLSQLPFGARLLLDKYRRMSFQ